MSVETDEYWMQKALALAEQAAASGEVPVGAVVVRDGKLIGEGCNGPIGRQDPTAHAEVLALRHAAETIGNYRMPRATLYVTIEPCTMCVGAMVHARIDRLVFGAREPKAGAVISQNTLLQHPAMNYVIDYSEGIRAEQCSRLISDFFAARRAQKRQQKAQLG